MKKQILNIYNVLPDRLRSLVCQTTPLESTKAYIKTSTDEKTLVNSHSNDLTYKSAVNVMERQYNFLRCIGYLSFTKDRIKLDSLPTLALAPQQNYVNY